MIERTRAILGIPTRVASESTAVIDVAERAFRAWPAVDDPPQVRIRIEVAAERSRGAGPDAVEYTPAGADRIAIGWGGGRIDVDARSGVAQGTVAAALLDAPETLRYGIIEAATLFMLTRRDRTPFHAAAVARGGRAVLLAGPSGTGKSTLAYAALRAGTGFTLLSEDCVYLQSRPAPRVWGWPGFLHLGAGSAAFFPELRGRRETVLANGKRKFAIATGDAPLSVQDAVLCLVRRTSGAPGLARMDACRALEILGNGLEPGFDVFADRIAQALRPFVAGAALRLDPGPDPNAAIHLLEELLDRPPG